MLINALRYICLFLGGNQIKGLEFNQKNKGTPWTLGSPSPSFTHEILAFLLRSTPAPEYGAFIKIPCLTSNFIP